ncbi:MAG: LysM peptidoglycan-binding domain-containing protein [Deltaproteobacteria bacterium]|nr:LysM peptidoglycan-binding domain-containing protein [Deltaproteobacteria bacterium]
MIRLALVTAALWSASIGPAWANEHVVRPGESLPQLAEQFYGDARRAAVLAAANSIPEVDEILIAGQRLLVPAPEFRVVAPEDTWESLAQLVLGDGRRAFLLEGANHAESASRPATGAEIVVPAVVAYRLRYGDGLAQVAERFYGSREGARLIKRFNFMQSARINHGQVLLIPLPELALTAAGRAALEANRASRGDGTRAASQATAAEAIRRLERLLGDGSYVEVVAAGNRLLASASDLSGNQVVSILRALGTAHVALDRPDLAIEAFREALRHQTDLECNPITTSPKVLEAFRTARARGPAAPGAP